jgi:predicted nucleotidyltransferase
MTDTEPINPGLVLHEHGDPDAIGREILRVVVGSTAHGLALPGQDDLDLMGIYVERAGDVCGLDPSRDRLPSHYTARTKPDGARSGPGDVDLTVYSLRRWLALAASGNPTTLLPLWIGEDGIKAEHQPYAGMLRALAPDLVTLDAGRRFAGYLRAQREKLLGQRGNRTNRPELIEVHGYDSKFAAHAIRLGVQGLQLLEEGRLTLPMPEEDRERVMQVRRGEPTLAQVVRRIERLETSLADALAEAADDHWWPEHVDRDRLGEVSARIHRQYWAEEDESREP